MTESLLMEVNSPAFVVSGQVRIPVRNLWLLLLYASDLFRSIHREKTAIEENPEEIPDLVAELLSHVVEKRLKRNLSYGFRSREAILSRVRGRIDVLKTEQDQLLSRGKVACRFEDLTINTPRNRFVRAALESIAKIVHRPELAHRCRVLGGSLKRMGVSGEKPGWAELAADQFSRTDVDDKFMVTAARLAFDLALPTEILGSRSLGLAEQDIGWVRRLFEKAIGGFYDVVLSPSGWRVHSGKSISWSMQQKTSGIEKIFPTMKTDVVLDHLGEGQRIVIDTKFTSIVTRGWYRDETLRSGYIYQIYAYLRSQEGNGDSLSAHASGLLLHPSVGEMVNETATIQGHAIRFATVDLGAKATEIRDQLCKMVLFPDYRLS